jgi:cobalamin biosynthesis protein CbiD
MYAALTSPPPWAKTVTAPFGPHLEKQSMTFRAAAKTLLVLALALPVMQSTLVWVAGLLTSMGDAAGAEIVRQVVTACQVVWAVGLVGLVIVLALVVLNEGSREARYKSREPEE